MITYNCNHILTYSNIFENQIKKQNMMHIISLWNITFHNMFFFDFFLRTCSVFEDQLEPANCICDCQLE